MSAFIHKNKTDALLNYSPFTWYSYFKNIKMPKNKN